VRDERILTGFAPDGARRRRVRPADFRAALAGRTVKDVLRRGKYLIFLLEPAKALLCHLRMTGQAIVGPVDRRARAAISFEGGGDALNFTDTRRFGEIWLAEDWTLDPSIQALGPEPLGNGWSPEDWGRALRASACKVQAALLDQRRLAGLGNIYVTEALFLSGIRPTRRCRQLRAAEVPALLKNVRAVLEKGLAHRGVSFYTYRDARGERGWAQDHLLCYGRAGEPCKNCGGALKGVKVNGRGTVYCPRCQK
jgi:formamidopyrimidine-DNA glycosylase